MYKWFMFFCTVFFTSLMLISVLVYWFDNPEKISESVNVKMMDTEIIIDQEQLNKLLPKGKINTNTISLTRFSDIICLNEKRCTFNSLINLVQYFQTAIDHNKDINEWIHKYPFNRWNIDHTDFNYQYSQAILKEEIIPSQVHKKHYGINSEAPQGEIVEARLPILFADLFRTARPAKEYSDKRLTYDTSHWPNVTSNFSANFTLLQNVNKGEIPDGLYTVHYEGDGTIQYEGYGKLIKRDVVNRKDVIRIDLTDPLKRMELHIKGDKVYNIRIVMPGGICKFNPYIHVTDELSCPTGTYQSFEKHISRNRNAIMFNPAYLRFMKDFKVLRMMNFMEASPGSRHCWTKVTEIPDPKDPSKTIKKTSMDYDCLLKPMEWTERARMSDATWGGSHLTERLDRFGKGLPIEVQIALVNQLDVDPWFTIPHNASSSYVLNFSSYVNKHLKKSLTPYVEYSNETWNGQFLATHYVRHLGRGLFNGKPNLYRDGLLFYAKKTREIHDLWYRHAGNRSFKRVVSTYQRSGDHSRSLLTSQYLKNRIDILSTGAYFYGCWAKQSHADCEGQDNYLSDVKSVDDVFNILSSTSDPYALTSLIKQLRDQASIAKENNVQLVVYEGGQHLTINWSNTPNDDQAKQIELQRRENLLSSVTSKLLPVLTRQEKLAINTIFHQANRSVKMRDLYLTLLNSWNELTDNGLFVAFSTPHSYQRFGSFGIKESLNDPRNSSPKYDATLLAQELSLLKQDNR